MASLIHLTDLSDSLSITKASAQFITWFSCTAWSVRADLLNSAEVLECWLLVKARLVFDSTSILCSCNMTPSFLRAIVFPLHKFCHNWRTELCTHTLMSVLSLRLSDVPRYFWESYKASWYKVRYIFHDSSNSFRSFLYIRNHHQRSRGRLLLLFLFLLLLLSLQLAFHLVKGPLRIPKSPRFLL